MLDPSSPVHIPNLDSAFVSNAVDPTQIGLPMLAPGSTQDVEVGVESTGVAHPGQGTLAADLVAGGDPYIGVLPGKDWISSIESLLPSQTAAAGTQPVFWYTATGHNRADEFFLHGGGFGTFYANRVTVPPPGSGPISLNIEHTRALRYKIEMSRVDTTFVGNLPVASTTTATVGFTTPTGCDPAAGSVGSLSAGTDDINVTLDPSMSSIVWGPNTNFINLTVTLDDCSLSPKFRWQKTFTIDSPSTIEP